MREIESEALTHKLNTRRIECLIIEKEALETAIHHFSELSDYQRFLISLRFGFHGGKVYTLQELGKWFGIDHWEIRLDLWRALSLLRDHGAHNALEEKANE